MHYFRTYELPTFKVLPMKIIKRLFNRQWVSTVLYAVYKNLSFIERVIEHEKCILNNTFGCTWGEATLRVRKIGSIGIYRYGQLHRFCNRYSIKLQIRLLARQLQAIHKQQAHLAY